MDYCLSNHRIHAIQLLPCTVKPSPSHRFSSSLCSNSFTKLRRIGSSFSRRKPFIVVSSRSNCEFSSLNTPLEPRSAQGKYLRRVLQNQRQLFHVAAAEELKQLADDRDAAVDRMILSAGSVESALHRRIAELKDSETKTAIEDVMYMLILSRFSDIKVLLVPKFSDCVYNGRLEICPVKDWELESIYSGDVLDMVKQHVYAVTGLRPNASVRDLWTTTKIHRCLLRDIYVASILYGYFLQSASTRYRLEHILRSKIPPFGLNNNNNNNNLVFGHKHETKPITPPPLDQDASVSRGKLSCYVMGFDSETLQRCKKVKTREAMDLIEKQTGALFGEGDMVSEVIVTSYSSMKRLVLEGVGFGSFLWDAEEYVDSVYKLSSN